MIRSALFLLITGDCTSSEHLKQVESAPYGVALPGLQKPPAEPRPTSCASGPTRIKRQTIEHRRFQHRKIAAAISTPDRASSPLNPELACLKCSDDVQAGSDDGVVLNGNRALPRAAERADQRDEISVEKASQHGPSFEGRAYLWDSRRNLL